tara:strand:+ start:717 stop:1934 length:1218 start_codon:yes stop_codon:yes gene_type:complete
VGVFREGMPGATQFDTSRLHAGHVLRANCVDTLSELCLSVVAANFNDHPKFPGIPTHLLSRVTELLPTTLPLAMTAPNIDDDGYWKRSALSRWESCQISQHGSSWKRLYFERHLTDFLECFNPLKGDAEELARVLCVSKEHVRSVRLRQVFSHLDLEMILHSLPMISSLEMTYTRHQTGTDSEPCLLGMKVHDVKSLASGLKEAGTLSALSLPCNSLNDTAVRMLASGLQKNTALTSLDLSHNKMADGGVKAIAKLLTESSSAMVSLKLPDNRIHADGGRYLGCALKQNTSLKHLDLRLNRLGDQGGRMLLEGVAENGTLRRLNLSCNALGMESASIAGGILANRAVLRSLDLSGNALSDEAGRLLEDSMVSNSTLTAMDLRLNQIAAETLANIGSICKRNAARV